MIWTIARSAQSHLQPVDVFKGQKPRVHFTANEPCKPFNHNKGLSVHTPQQFVLQVQSLFPTHYKPHLQLYTYIIQNTHRTVRHCLNYVEHSHVHFHDEVNCNIYGVNTISNTSINWIPYNTKGNFYFLICGVVTLDYIRLYLNICQPLLHINLGLWC